MIETWAVVLGKKIDLALVENSKADTTFLALDQVVNQVIPNLKKDVFERYDEYKERLENLGFLQVGEAILLREKYNIEKEEFPVKVEWKLNQLDTPVIFNPYLHISRDLAKQLFSSAVSFPCLAKLSARNQEYVFDSYSISSPLGMFSVETKQILQVGDYVQFGRYNKESIIWRVISIDDDMNPVLFSELVLCCKSFDDEGDYHHLDERIENGSNYWCDSNLRQWLNSDEQQIQWTQNDPYYGEEVGFLHRNNFTQAEKNMIRQYSRKVLLTDADDYEAIGGSEVFELDSRVPSDSLSNEAKAYFHEVSDYVFCLSVREMVEWICANEHILGESFLLGIDADGETNGYFLCTPEGNDSSGVIGIGEEGQLNYYYCNSDIGIRPALMLDGANLFIQDGKGTKTKPYKLN